MASRCVCFDKVKSMLMLVLCMLYTLLHQYMQLPRTVICVNAGKKLKQYLGVFVCVMTHLTDQPAVQVYPTLVIRGTGLYELWKKGLYRNYEPTQLIDLVARILALVPPWVRIYRIQVTPLLLLPAVPPPSCHQQAMVAAFCDTHGPATCVYIQGCEHQLLGLHLKTPQQRRHS